MNKKVDLDFNAKRRDEVFAHLYDKYKNGFAHIGTHGTLQAKNAFKDVCRIFNVPFQEANTLSSLIPDGSESIEDALKDEKFSTKINADENLKDVVRYSKALEGTIKSYGVHASFGYDAKLQTRTGPIRIGDLENKTIEILTPNGWKYATITKTGYKEIVKYKISNSKYSNVKDFLHVTDNHSILSRELNWLEAKDFNGIFLAKEFSDFNPLDFLAGWFWNDGSYDNNSSYGYLFFTPGKDDDAFRYISSNFNLIQISNIQYKIDKDTLNLIIDKFGIESLGKNKEKLPPSKGLDLESLRGWLSGLFSSSSTIQRGFLILKLTSEKVVNFCLDSLGFFGIEKSFLQKIIGKDIEFSNGKYKCRDSYELGIGRYNSFKFLTLIGLIQEYKKEKILDMSLWDTFRTERYLGDVFDFEIITNLEHERMAYVDGVICHNCLKYNQRVFANGEFISLEKAYDRYYRHTDKKHPVKIRTINGDRYGLIHETTKKNSYSAILYSEDKRSIISEVEVSSDHKILLNDKYVSYRELESNVFYEHNIINNVPDSISGFFIAGFLLPLISNNTVYGICNWNVSDEIISLIADFLEVFYVGGEKEFREEWSINFKNPDIILNKIENIVGITIYNDVILHHRKYDPIEFSDILDNTDFLSGLFSSFKKISNYQYGHKGLCVNSIKKHLSFSLRKFGIIFNNSYLEFSSTDLTRFITYKDTVLFFTTFPKSFLVKGKKVDTNAVKMFDVQILTDNPKNQNFICNGVSVSNCGVILSPVPLNETIPLFAVNGLPTTMYDGDVCEKLKFIKVDLLGVKVLAIIDETLKFINKNPKYLNIESVYKLPLDDQTSYNMLERGDVLGVFQLEGGSIAPYVPQCKPKNIDDIAAILATIRPGPISLGMDKLLIDAMSKGEHFEFDFPKYNHIFKDTYGLFLYQEQLMQLAGSMCNFDPIKQDVLRKATGKKDEALLNSLKEDFINGAILNGESKQKLEEFWEKMLGFSRYSFNKSHKILKAYH